MKDTHCFMKISYYHDDKFLQLNSIKHLFIHSDQLKRKIMQQTLRIQCGVYILFVRLNYVLVHAIELSEFCL